jgi:uncharacterized protein YjiS (DUF1127 family)
MNFFDKIREARAKRRLYNRTVSEISSLSRREAMDLGFFPEDARAIAYRSVYGG